MAHDANRVFGLDLLRAMAVLFVVYAHGYDYLAHSVSDAWYMLPVFDGVTIFFVLSGFLIGRILLRTVMRSDFDLGMLWVFWLRRWFRTLPNYFLVLGCLVVVYGIQHRTLPDELPAYLFFMQNFATPHPDFFPEAWSLSVEEWFYLLTPIVLLGSFKFFPTFTKPTLVLTWIVTVLLAVWVFRVCRVLMDEQLNAITWDLMLRKQVVTRMDSLMFGVLGAYCQVYCSRFWGQQRLLLLKIGLGLLLLDKLLVSLASGSYLYVVYMKYAVFSVTSIGVLCLLPWLCAWQSASGWLPSLLQRISLWSYAMYLLNYTPIKGLVMPWVLQQLSDIGPSYLQVPAVAYALFWLLTLVASVMLYYGFERPVMALRDKCTVKGQPLVTVFDGIKRD